MGRRGEKSLLCDRGSELCLVTEKENEKRANIMDWMKKKKKSPRVKLHHPQRSIGLQLGLWRRSKGEFRVLRVAACTAAAVWRRVRTEGFSVGAVASGTIVGYPRELNTGFERMRVSNLTAVRNRDLIRVSRSVRQPLSHTS